MRQWTYSALVYGAVAEGMFTNHSHVSAAQGLNFNSAAEIIVKSWVDGFLLTTIGLILYRTINVHTIHKCSSYSRKCRKKEGKLKFFAPISESSCDQNNIIKLLLLRQQ